MIKLSVNINKIATLRNARGGNNPDLIQAAMDCQRFGADGITIHPRPDQRHIRYEDVAQLKNVVDTELNIEGNPMETKFVDLVLANKPHQVTLVPDAEDQLTSNHGWDTLGHKDFLRNIITVFKQEGISVSIFMDPDPALMVHAAATGTDRIELYTEAYAQQFPSNPESAIQTYIDSAIAADLEGLGINAGHDLDRYNLKYFAGRVPHLKEVSIGHALICDALYLGLENTIQLYKRCLI
ncbi:MAG: pyridoxine 5'-phosphate synthase [Chitinophagaceae bacterium]|nr:pyridoxine 5'-phosphate synthase [Chitinophagaceae bacterium]